MSKTPKLTLLIGGKAEIEVITEDPKTVIDICGLKIDLTGRSRENLAVIGTLGAALASVVDDEGIVGAAIVLHGTPHVDEAGDEDNAFVALTTTTNLIRLGGYLEYIKQRIYSVFQ